MDGVDSYTFTPAAGQCASSFTMNVTIVSPATPMFNPIGPYCQNSYASKLPTTSANMISGNWSPAAVNTANAGTTTYTFTPNAGQCAKAVNVDIVVNPHTTPTFNSIGDLCQYSTAPVLPGTSTNIPAISGTWKPATINTSTVGTTSYTFTPTPGQCANPTTMTITITAQNKPAFNEIGTLCQNSISPILPANSTNNPAITGTWSPANISTSVLGTTTYTFTPDDGQCATASTMDITIATMGTPLFAQIGPLCQNSTPPVLSTRSGNTPVITGTWSPATINTAIAGTTTYVFTPDAGQCAMSTSLDITINPEIISTFTAIDPLCQNSIAPVLSVNSENSPAISGTWNPSTIATNVVGTTTYTFTPGSGQCATKALQDVVVLPTAHSTTQVNLCSTQLPYSWNGQSFTATGTYIVKLVSQNGCDSITTLDLTLTPAVTPLFNQIAPFLQNSVAPELSDTSLNGIHGKWSPEVIDVTTAGISTYTFTPDADQCANLVKMDITVLMDAIITGQSVTGLCTQSNLDASKSIGDIVKYEWTVLDQGGILDTPSGLTTSFKLSPTYTGPLPANFRVKLEITSRNGLTRSDTILIKVDQQPVAAVSSEGNLEKDGSMIVDGSISTGATIKYKWSSAQGKVIGPDNEPTAKLYGAGIYTLEISDIHGCVDTKTFQFPMAFHSIVANPDNARIAWDQDTTINVLANDRSTVYLRPTTVTVTNLPSRGSTNVNADGTITYAPRGKESGYDKFMYEVCDTLNFCASTTVTIEIYDTGLKIPEGFSPNGDGSNDQFVIQDIQLYHPKSQLYVYTRSGQLVYQSADYGLDGKFWDGRMANHQLVPTGTYYYVLQINYPFSKTIKGFVYIGY